MASSIGYEVRSRKDKLRDEILSYKLSKAVPCNDERVVSPDKLIIGMRYPFGYAYDIVCALRLALHGDVEPSMPADTRQTSTDDEEEYLTDSISVIAQNDCEYGSSEADLAGKFGCMVLLVRPSNSEFYQQWIQDIKGITGCPPLCGVITNGGSEPIEETTHYLKKHGVTDIYVVHKPDDILSDEEELQWLDLLHGCLCVADGGTLYSNPSFEKQEREEAKKARKRHEEENREQEDTKKLLHRRITDLEQESNESRASREGIVSESASLKDTMKVEQERRDKSERALSENEKRAKLVLEMYKQSEIELKKKLKSKDLRIETLAENLQRSEKTASLKIERLNIENEEMTKNLESKQQRVDTLTEIVGEKERNETTLRQHVEELKKGREEDRAGFEKEKQSIELSWKKELDTKEQRSKQLERETWKLRTKIQLESEIRSAKQKKKAETHQWNFIRWMTPGKQAQGGLTSSRDNSSEECYQSERSNASQAEEEPTNNEFADILKQIAHDLSDETQIDSLGSQLGIIQGDIARALKTNMICEQVNSRGTHLMLTQWRRGVSREDERIELRRALVAAKLLDLAVHYFPQGTGTGPGPGPELPQKMEGSHQLPGIDSTPSAQGLSRGRTETKESTAATDQPRLYDQSSKNQGDEPSECMDQLSEELSNQSTAGVHDTSKDMPYGGLTGLEHPQKIGEAPGSSGGQDKTNKPTTITHQALDDKSPKNQREEASEGMDQYSEESSINNIADDVRETSVDVSSNEPFAEGTSISDERSVEDITINYSDLLSNLALTETSSEKLLMIFLMKVFIDFPPKVFVG